MLLGLYLAELLKRMERGPRLALWDSGVLQRPQFLFTRAAAPDCCLGYFTPRNCRPTAGPWPKQDKSRSSVGARP